MWLRETTGEERKTLFAAFAGYGVDAFDFMIFTFIIPTLIDVWHITKADAGYIATSALLTSAAGGWLAGILADRYGRVRILMVTVAWFSLFTLISGFTNSFEELLLTRSMQGFGFGGEWSVGSVLISEMIDAKHRGKANGLVQSSWAVGWGLAAIASWGISSLVEPKLAWRILFWLGVLPALLIVYIRRNLKEPKVYQSAVKGDFLQIFSPSLLLTTVRASLLATGMQGGYYAITTWLPTFLQKERHLSVLDSSGYLLVLILGSFIGYLTSAYLTDLLGRRRCFILFAICAGSLIVVYTQIPVTDQLMLFLGFPLGFFLSGIFSGMGAFLSELFPSRVRGSGQGFCYNFGRAAGALCPTLVGYLSQTMPLGIAIGYLAAGAYLLVVVSALSLPETKGRSLSEEEEPAAAEDAGGTNTPSAAGPAEQNPIISREAQAVIDGLTAHSWKREKIDRQAVEAAITRHLSELALPKRPYRWFGTVKEGSTAATAAASKAAARRAAWAWTGRRAAARASAWNAAMDARLAAWDAARAAARDDARDAAKTVAWNAAWDAARAAAWETAWAAALAAARNTAWEATRDGAWDDASDAARAARDARDADTDAAFSAAWAAAELNALNACNHPSQVKVVAIWLPMVEAFKSGLGLYWITPSCVICVEQPSLQINDNRLHCPDGPAAVWPGGESYYFWRGVQVPSEWISKPGVLDAKTAITWSNAEQRRAACEIVGWAKILNELEATTIDADGDPEIGCLVEVSIPDAPDPGRERFLLVRCGTGRDFALPVPRHMKTAREAQAWTWGLTIEAFKQPEVRT